MTTQAQSVARKFWEVFPAVMRITFAQARRSSNNLSPSHLRILHVVSSRPCNLSELAERQDVTLPTMSATVNTLVERGWLERVRSEGDRREIQLRMSDEGRRVLASEHRRLSEWVAAKLETLEARDVKRVERALDILLHLFEEVSARTTEEPVKD